MALLHEAILLNIVVLGLLAECSESMAIESFTMNNATVMSLLFLIVGVLLIGNDMGGLTD